MWGRQWKFPVVADDGRSTGHFPRKFRRQKRGRFIATELIGGVSAGRRQCGAVEAERKNGCGSAATFSDLFVFSQVGHCGVHFEWISGEKKKKQKKKKFQGDVRWRNNEKNLWKEIMDEERLIFLLWLDNCPSWSPAAVISSTAFLSVRTHSTIITWIMSFVISILWPLTGRIDGARRFHHGRGNRTFFHWNQLESNILLRNVWPSRNNWIFWEKKCKKNFFFS